MDSLKILLDMYFNFKPSKRGLQKPLPTGAVSEEYEDEHIEELAFVIGMGENNDHHE